MKTLGKRVLSKS